MTAKKSRGSTKQTNSQPSGKVDKPRTWTRDVIIAIVGIIVGATCALLSLGPGSIGYSALLSVGVIRPTETPTEIPTATATASSTPTATSTSTPTPSATPTLSPCERVIQGDRAIAFPDCYNEIIHITPVAEVDYLKLGYYHFAIQDWYNASTYFADAMKINPKSALAARGQCMTTAAMSDRSDSQIFGDCTLAISLASQSPDMAIAYALRGYANFLNHECAAATNDFEKALQLDPLSQDIVSGQSVLEDYEEAKIYMDNNYCGNTGSG